MLDFSDKKSSIFHGIKIPVITQSAIVNQKDLKSVDYRKSASIKLISSLTM
jgi:hypothetical protein